MSLLGRLLMGAGMQLPRTLDNIEQRQMRERELARREQIERARMERDDEKLALQRELGLLRLAQSAPRSSGSGSGGGGPGGGSVGGGAEEAALAQTAAEEGLMPEEITALRERRNPFMTSGGAAGEMPDSERWRKVFSNFNRNLARSMAGKDADSISRSRQIDQETEARDRIIRTGDTTAARSLDMARGDPPMDESGGVVLDKWSGENKPTPVGSAKITRDKASANRDNAAAGKSSAERTGLRDSEVMRSLEGDVTRASGEVSRLRKERSELKGAPRAVEARRKELDAEIEEAQRRLQEAEAELRRMRSGGQSGQNAPSRAASPAASPAPSRVNQFRVIRE